MSYFKNNLYRYYKLVVKLRIAIITVFSLIFLYLVFNMTTLLTHNDDELWLQGSNEYTRLLKNNHDTDRVILEGVVLQDVLIT